MDHINMKKPSNEEIDNITTKRVAQAQSTYNLRNMTINGAPVKAIGIFIKDTTTKVTNENKKGTPKTSKIKDKKNKKWEPKMKVHFQGIETTKKNAQEKKLDLDRVKKKKSSIDQEKGVIYCSKFYIYRYVY